MEQFSKQPSEKYPIAIECFGRIPIGTSISSATVAAVRLVDDVVDNSVLYSQAATISGTQAQVIVKDGTSGKKYQITFTITLSDGSVLEEDITMIVESI